MPDRIPFDFTLEEREEMQLVQAELDLHPGRLKIFIAELTLLRQLCAWASDHRDRFPPRLRSKLHALTHRAELHRAAAEHRAELEP